MSGTETTAKHGQAQITGDGEPPLPTFTTTHPIRFLLATLIALGPFTMALYTPSMPAIAASLGASKSLVQSSISVYLFAVVAGQLFYGPLSDRFGRRRMLFSGFVLFILASLLCASAGNITTLLIGRVLQGFGASAGAVMSRAIIRDLYEKSDIAKMLSFIGMALAVAPAIGPLLGGQLQSLFDWHANFLVLVLAGLVLIYLVWRFLPETNRNTSRNPVIASYATLLGSRLYLGYAGAVGAALGGIFSFHSIAPFVLIDQLGIAPTHYGFYTIANVAGYFSGAYISNRLAGQVSSERMIGIGLCLAAAAVSAMLAVVTLTELRAVTFIAPCVFWTFSAGLIMPNGATGALQPFPRIAGAASALLGAIQIGSGAVTSLIISRIGGYLPLTFAEASASLVMVGACLYLWGVVFNPARKAVSHAAAMEPDIRPEQEPRKNPEAEPEGSAAGSLRPAE
jgi:MFS transporter, DHA1 family, multidrug resistance protein